MSLLAQAATGTLNYSPPALEAFASTTAVTFGLDKKAFLATIDCESGFRASVLGDDGQSLGVAQIDLKYHPDITRAEAMEPYWSILWMAYEWQHNKADMWSCWRNLFS